MTKLSPLFYVGISIVSSLLAAFSMLTSLIILSQFDEQIQTAAVVIEPTPVPNGAMWSLGTGGYDDLPYYEWVAVYPESTLWQLPGAPSLRFTDHAQEREDFQRDFEIGFYRYGPTWYSRHFITEFWLGAGAGGTLSVAGNDNGGGELQIRNPADDDSISIDFRNPRRPTIQTETGRPLYLSPREGVISSTMHTFESGISLMENSGYAGISLGGWNNGRQVVFSDAAYPENVIIVTPVSQPQGQWWVDNISSDKSFTVFSTANDEDMQFNWLIIGTTASHG